MAGRLKPLDVEREAKPGKYADGDGLYGHVTVHGFRSTFATWAEDCTDYPDGVREAALAHKYKSETTAAYQRGQKLEKRRALMNDWAAFVGRSSVVLMRGAA